MLAPYEPENGQTNAAAPFLTLPRAPGTVTVTANGDERFTVRDPEIELEVLAASPDRIHDLVQLGKLNPRRDGRRLLFRREALYAYLVDEDSG
jgi:hypothetical protein